MLDVFYYNAIGNTRGKSNFFANIKPFTVRAYFFRLGQGVILLNIAFNCAVVTQNFSIVIALAINIIRTRFANLVTVQNEIEFFIIYTAFDSGHIFAKTVAVTLTAKTLYTKQMMIPYFHYFINFLSLFVSTQAMAILTASGIKNGITHQPRIVPIVALSPEFAYTTANHTVPKA